MRAKTNYLDISRFKRSSAGTTVDSDTDLEVKYRYTLIGNFFLTFFGTTRMPLEISFRCKKSNETFEILKDPDLIAYYEMYKRN